MKECPVCKEELSVEQLFTDNFARREIYTHLHVFCPFKKYGCEQTFPLASHNVNIFLIK